MDFCKQALNRNGSFINSMGLIRATGTVCLLIPWVSLDPRKKKVCSLIPWVSLDTRDRFVY